MQWRPWQGMLKVYGSLDLQGLPKTAVLKDSSLACGMTGQWKFCKVVSMEGGQAIAGMHAYDGDT